jgi:RNA polymerase sigma factor (sigma-70 family)
MDARTPQTPADRLEEVYRARMVPLVERIRAWFPTLQGIEEDLYQAAWASLLAKSRQIEDVEKYLEAAVFNAGLMELRRQRRHPIVSLSGARFKNGAGGRGAWQQGVDALVDPTEPLPEEQVESREDARLLGELLEELTPLQRKIIKLRWGAGISRREAAALLGISERSVKREMLKAVPIIARNAELARAEKWCEQQQRLVVAFCLGLVGPARAVKARKHLERCSTCREVALAVRDRLRGLAAALPFPALATSPSADGMFTRAAEWGDSIWSGFSHSAAGAKEQALGLFARTPAADTAASQLAVGGGLRGGGSALAAVTACLIAGGGATYCAVEGVPEPIRDLTPIERSSKKHVRSDLPEETDPQAPVAEQPPPSASIPQPDFVESKPKSAEPKPRSSPADVTTEAQPSPAPAGNAEFGLASGAAKRSAPAPAPSSGGGEFTP